MTPFSDRLSRMVSRWMDRLSPMGVDFHCFLKAGRMYYNDGVELNDIEAVLFIRTIKAAMRDAKKEKSQRRPMVVASLGGCSAAIVGDEMSDVDGNLLAADPVLAEIAAKLGVAVGRRRKTRRRH